MSRGKKNSTTPSAAAKITSNPVAEPIKEKAAVPKTKSVKPTAEKKTAMPKKATTAKSSSKTRTTKKPRTLLPQLKREF